MAKPNEIKLDAKSIYQTLNDDFTSHRKDVLIMSHFGEFSQDLVNSLSEGLENILNLNNVKRNLIKRLFSIMIEGLQNIRLHGVRNNNNRQCGHVMILEEHQNYSFSFGNIVDEKGKKTLTQYMEKLNAMDLSEKKAYYLDVLGNGIRTDKGGAGLGFTTIALKAKSEILYQFINFEGDKYYFEMRADLLP